MQISSEGFLIVQLYGLSWLINPGADLQSGPLSTLPAPYLEEEKNINPDSARDITDKQLEILYENFGND